MRSRAQATNTNSTSCLCHCAAIKARVRVAVKKTADPEQATALLRTPFQLIPYQVRSSHSALAPHAAFVRFRCRRLLCAHVPSAALTTHNSIDRSPFCVGPVARGSVQEFSKTRPGKRVAQPADRRRGPFGIHPNKLGLCPLIDGGQFSWQPALLDQLAKTKDQ